MNRNSSNPPPNEREAIERELNRIFDLYLPGKVAPGYQGQSEAVVKLQHEHVDSLRRGLTRQLATLLTQTAQEAELRSRIDELDMALAMKGKVLLQGTIIDATVMGQSADSIDVNILEARLEALRRQHNKTETN